MKDFSKKFNGLEKFPMTFRYGESVYRGFSGENFKLLQEKTRKDEKKETTVTELLLNEQIKIDLQRVFYPKYGFYEWSVSFENIGKTNSEYISDVYADLSLKCEQPVLRGILGDHVNQYRPYAKDITVEKVRFVSDGGRPTHVYFPYFNLTCEGGGAFIVIGWAGTWSAEFKYEDGVVDFNGRSIISLNTYLKPNQRITSATYVCGLYKGNYYDSVNLWRRWFIDNNMPKFDPQSESMRPFSTLAFVNDTGRPNSDGSISEDYTTWKPTFDKMREVGCHPDFRWFDAGWYIAPDKGDIGLDWESIGTWELCPNRWPGNTFAESCEHLHKHGIRTLMWFEPEAVTRPDILEKNFGYKREWAIDIDGFKRMYNNIGDPDCYKWTRDRVLKVLRENKIDMFREDFNMQPGPSWDYLDQELGQYGITEHDAVMAHYKLWDEIIECTSSYGGCSFIDSCASGGGRNDLLSLRRAIPMLRSDSDRVTSALRLSMTASFDEWIPFTGANTREKPDQLSPLGISDVYIWRASYLPVLNIDAQFTQDPDQDFSILLNGIAEWDKVKPYLLKDFYVLTPWHDQYDKSGFTALCYYDPKKEKGALLVFRMEDCEHETVNIKLPFARGGADYTLTDEDTGDVRMLTCEDCLGGFDFSIAKKRQAKLIWVEKK